MINASLVTDCFNGDSVICLIIQVLNLIKISFKYMLVISFYFVKLLD